MFKKQLFKCWVFFWVSAISLLLVSSPSLGQVRFEEPVNLSQAPIDTWNPRIAAVEDQVFVFLVDQIPVSPYVQLYHSRDKGRSFRTWNLSPGIQSPYPAGVVSDGNNIYVGFAGIVDRSDLTNVGVFLSRSNDRGESFYPPFDISGRRVFSSPIMRIQDGLLNVAWIERGVAFTKSLDFGKTFRERSIAYQDQPGATTQLELALDGDQVYLAWMNHSPRTAYHEIYFTHSTDGGKTFGEVVNFSQIQEYMGLSFDPQLAVGSKGSVYVAWVQGRDPLLGPLLVDIYFARSTDGGETFSERLNLSNNPRAYNLSPQMVAAGDNVYVVWSGLVGGASDIFLSRSTDGGKTFREPQNISHNPGGSVAPQIAVLEKGKLLDKCLTEDVVYLVWQDGTPGTDEVFFSVSRDSGATFSEPENISHTRSFASGPLMAAAGRNVYVTWMDNPAGHWDVLFTRGELELDDPDCPIKERKPNFHESKGGPPDILTAQQ